MSQAEYADACSIDQSQLSRFMQGRFQRLSKNLRTLCIYARVDVSGSPPRDRRSSELLMEAIDQLWNGRPEHARAIARLLLAAKALADTERQK